MILRFLCPAIELRSGSFFVCKCDRRSFKRRKSCVPTRRERVRLTSDRVPLGRFIQPGLAPVFRDLQKWSWCHDHFGKPAKTVSKWGSRPAGGLAPPGHPWATPGGAKITKILIFWWTPVCRNMTMLGPETTLYGVKQHSGVVWRRRSAANYPVLALGAFSGPPWARP